MTGLVVPGVASIRLLGSTDLLCFFLAMFASAVLASLAVTDPKNYAALFDAWKTEHGKSYGSAAAEAKAFRAFAENEDTITVHNKAECCLLYTSPSPRDS